MVFFLQTARWNLVLGLKKDNDWTKLYKVSYWKGKSRADYTQDSNNFMLMDKVVKCGQRVLIV